MYIHKVLGTAATKGGCEIYIECHSDDQHKGGALFVLWRVLS